MTGWMRASALQCSAIVIQNVGRVLYACIDEMQCYHFVYDTRKACLLLGLYIVLCCVRHPFRLEVSISHNMYAYTLRTE